MVQNIDLESSSISTRCSLIQYDNNIIDDSQERLEYADCVFSTCLKKIPNVSSQITKQMLQYHTAFVNERITRQQYALRMEEMVEYCCQQNAWLLKYEQLDVKQLFKQDGEHLSGKPRQSSRKHVSMIKPNRHLFPEPQINASRAPRGLLEPKENEKCMNLRKPGMLLSKSQYDSKKANSKKEKIGKIVRLSSKKKEKATNEEYKSHPKYENFLSSDTRKMLSLCLQSAYNELDCTKREEFIEKVIMQIRQWWSQFYGQEQHQHKSIKQLRQILRKFSCPQNPFKNRKQQNNYYAIISQDENVYLLQDGTLVSIKPEHNWQETKKMKNTGQISPLSCLEQHDVLGEI